MLSWQKHTKNSNFQALNQFRTIKFITHHLYLCMYNILFIHKQAYNIVYRKTIVYAHPQQYPTKFQTVKPPRIVHGVIQRNSIEPLCFFVENDMRQRIEDKQKNKVVPHKYKVTKKT